MHPAIQIEALRQLAQGPLGHWGTCLDPIYGLVLDDIEAELKRQNRAENLFVAQESLKLSDNPGILDLKLQAWPS